MACGGGSVPTDARLEWLREHAVPIRSADVDDTDFSDLEPLRDALGDARVVLIGEASHQSGATFLLRGRILRFLHEAASFDLLAVESGLVGMARADSALAAGWGPSERMPGLYGTWASSDQARPLLAYVAQTQRTARPVRVAGFDIQFAFGDAEGDREALRRWVGRAFGDGGSARPDRETRAALDDFLTARGPWSSDAETTSRAVFAETRAAIIRAIDSLDAIDSRDSASRASAVEAGSGAAPVGASAASLPLSPQDDLPFLRRSLTSLRAYVALLERFTFPPPDIDWEWGTEIRDTAMAGNLTWLARERHPEERIAGWTHSGHLYRNPDAIDPLDSGVDFAGKVPMGHAAHEALGDSLYTIGVIAYGGTEREGLRTVEIPPAPDGSLEALLHRLGEPYLFVDLRGLPEDHWLRGELVARPLKYLPMRADWSRVFDGLLYLEETTPSTRGG